MALLFTVPNLKAGYKTEHLSQIEASASGEQNNQTTLAREDRLGNSGCRGESKNVQVHCHNADCLADDFSELAGYNPDPKWVGGSLNGVMMRLIRTLGCFGVVLGLMASPLLGADVAAGSAPPVTPAGPKMMSLGQMFEAGGTIGYIITGLSVLMVSLIVEHLISLRRNALMPPGLADSIHHHLSLRHFEEARQQCQFQPSFLAYVLASGLKETDLGYAAVEKGLEDSAVEQSARLYRKIEYLSVIGTIAPMLGLLGTVWGMILAFMEFEQKANPQVSELAPGIYKALVTTLQGLCVAIPALAAFAHFRNRIDQLVADGALTAEAVFSEYKRMAIAEPKSERMKAAASMRGKPASEQQLANPGTATVAAQAKRLARGSQDHGSEEPRGTP